MAQYAREVKSFDHHLKQDASGNRPQYRKGKKSTVVKVYTISQESIYIIVTGVPSIGATAELRDKCDKFGDVLELYILDSYPCEKFTDAFLIKYKLLPSARAAKKKLDDGSFMGGILHVFYAPEFETPEETQQKLLGRMKHVANVTGRKYCLAMKPTPMAHQSLAQNSNLNFSNNQSQSTYVWAGKTYSCNPIADQFVTNSLNVQTGSSSFSKAQRGGNVKHRSSVFIPRQLAGQKRKLDGSSKFKGYNWSGS